MRIVFIGTVRFSENVLTKLIGMSVDVVGVCTLNKSPSNADHVDLAPFCRKHNIPVKYVTDINAKESINWIKALSPDIIFCFGWSQLLKTQLLYLAPLGVIGYHPTSLPANRGRHPLIWALVLGLKETASTFFFMDDGADSGDILSQYPIKISDNDTAGTLYKRITEVALKQVDEFIPALVSGAYKRVEQNHSLSNTWRKRGKDDGKIDWRMSAKSIHNLVRGLTKPYVGAHFILQGKAIKVWETELVINSQKNVEPGKVIFVDEKEFIVKAGENAIRLLKTEPVLDIKRGSYL
jgi:methionyl-tRNA formyltransferase